MQSLLARLLLIVTSALIPALGFQAYAEYQARGIRQRLVEDEALRILRLVESEQQRIIDGASQVLNVISSAPLVMARNPTDCHELLANLIRQSPRYSGGGVIGLDGKLICSPSLSRIGMDLSDRGFFRRALQTDGFVIGEYAVGRGTHMPIIPMAKPLRDESGKVVGVVEITLSLAWLGEQLDRLDLPPGTIVTIADRNGVFLARRPGGMQFVGQPISGANRILLEGDHVRVFGPTSLDESPPLMVAYSPPAANPEGFSVGIGLDRDASFARLAQANRTGLFLIVAGAGFALALTALTGNRLIRRPIARLLNAAEQWRAGDLSARVALGDDRSEFGRLAASFDRMAAAHQAREQDLRRSQEQSRAVFEQAAAGIALSAPDGTWLDVNEKMCAITGYRRDELVHRNAMEFTHPEDRRSNLAQRRALLAGECQTVTYEKRFVRPDGGVVWTILAVSLLRGANGAPERFLVVADDISERRRAEIELRRLAMHLEARVHEEVAARQAAQARAAHAERMQTLGQLAGGIAHDFNNVLQALEGAATLIERKAADPASVRRLALLAQEAVGRGASITRRLLAFGRRADLRAEALDVAELLDGLREILAHTLGAAIDVCVSLADDLPPVFADKAQLETALVNLATNARDAMPTGGRLTFAADHETVVHADKAGLAPGRYIRFTVTDTGHGMDAATLARVGEPFFTTKEVGAGTGLGLPMARGFAEQSGGALSIDSSPGTGTTVTLWLPQAAAHAGGGIRRSQRSATGTTTSIRVLLVDDEELVRDTLAEHLLSSGCGVVAARSGSEALALLESGEQVDVLVTDLSMPEIDGVAVIQAVRQILPGLPVVLLTGYAGDGTALAMSGPLSGAFSLLRKPVRPEQLLDRINVLLAAQQQPAG